jgi:glycosyltransferase involved in cell wall biosynthesis
MMRRIMFVFSMLWLLVVVVPAHAQTLGSYAPPDHPRACLPLNSAPAPAEKVGTVLSFMSDRHRDLRETVAGYERTGRELVAFDGASLLPAGCADDPGLFYFVPKLMRAAQLPLDRAIDLFFGGILICAVLVGSAGMLSLFDATWKRCAGLLIILLLCAEAARIGDVYVIPVALAVAIVPLLLYLTAAAAAARKVAVFAICAGLLLGTANLIRSHSATSVLILTVILLCFRWTAKHRSKAVVLSLLAISILIPSLASKSILNRRDAYLRNAGVNYANAVRWHPFWHTAYIGFGFLTNDIVPAYKDAVAASKVRSIAPETVYCSAEYEKYLRREVFAIVKQHPQFVLFTIFAKLGVILLFLLVSANVGLLAALLRPKPWPVELGFWGALWFSALPALLAIPGTPYLLGFLSLGMLYAVISIEAALEAREPGAVRSQVHVIEWFGAPVDALQQVATSFPGCDIVPLSAREFREAGWKGQLRTLRGLRGEAVVFFFESLKDNNQEQLLAWCGLVHRCKRTVLADSQGTFRSYSRADWLRLGPETLASLLTDAAILVSTWVRLRLLAKSAKPVDGSPERCDLDVVYLLPYAFAEKAVGGAITHVRGVLQGMADNDVRCEVFYNTMCPANCFPATAVPQRKRRFLFWECQRLAYNWQFAREVRQKFRGRTPKAIYQRHGTFVIAGALLSRWLRIPLVLEYNHSEQWMARHWDPVRFCPWLRLCERFVLQLASTFVVVSEALKDELVAQGVSAHRILVNPNGVDARQFRPGCGGLDRRSKLGFSLEDVVVGFAGTFGYWHGVEVLQDAIKNLLTNGRSDTVPALKFLLIGKGVLSEEIRDGLRSFEESGQVVFTGAIPFEEMPSYLDSADILVSPHVPMPDGRPFFGSPTKLFEYMAMEKPIVASNLDQLAEVLSHDQTAWLVPPGDAAALGMAIRLLARNNEIRLRLGREARKIAVEKYTWEQNVKRVLSNIGIRHGAMGKLAAVQVQSRPEELR